MGIRESVRGGGPDAGRLWLCLAALRAAIFLLGHPNVIFRSLVSFLCLFLLRALYLLRVLCVEALLCKSLQSLELCVASNASETIQLMQSSLPFLIFKYGVHRRQEKGNLKTPTF